MALSCTFRLNGQRYSSLDCSELGCMIAFSGVGGSRDQPGAVGTADAGPLPPGRYFIVDRQSGGRMGAIRDFFNADIYGTDRSDWFGLYRDDGWVDDVTWVGNVQRGGFRLHPIGPLRMSKGCITLASPADFARLRTRLKAGPNIRIPCQMGMAYGTVYVR